MRKMDIKIIHLLIIVLCVWFHVGTMKSEGKKADRTTTTTARTANTPKWNLTALDYMKMFAPDKVKFLPKNLTFSEATTTETSTEETDVTVTEKEESYVYETDSDESASESEELLGATTKEETSLMTNDDTSTEPYDINDLSTLDEGIQNVTSSSSSSSKSPILADNTNKSYLGTNQTETKTIPTSLSVTSNSNNVDLTPLVNDGNDTPIIITQNIKVSKINSEVTTPNLPEEPTSKMVSKKQNLEMKHPNVKNDSLQLVTSAKVSNKTKLLSAQFTTLRQVSSLKSAKTTTEVESSSSFTQSLTVPMTPMTPTSTISETTVETDNVTESVTDTESLSDMTHATSTDAASSTDSSAESTSVSSSWFKSAIPKFVDVMKKLNGSAINKTSIDYSKFNTKPGTVITTSAPASSANPPPPSDDRYWSKQKNMSTGMLTGLILMIVLAIACTIASIFAIQWYKHQRKVEDSIALMSNRHGQRRPFYYYDSTM